MQSDESNVGIRRVTNTELTLPVVQDETESKGCNSEGQAQLNLTKVAVE